MADPVPEETEDQHTTRRAFVKGCVAACGLGTVAAAAYAMGAPLAIVERGEANVVPYIGAAKVAGPAPRGIPWIPIDVDANGNLIGRTEFEGVNVLDWYRYCGHEGAPGLTPEGWTGDAFIRYFIPEDKVAQGYTPWFLGRARQNAPMNVRDFEAQPVGQGAAGNWRSDIRDPTKSNLITVIVIKIDPENVDALVQFEGVRGPWQTAAMDIIRRTGFVGFVTFCTHFCCVPGWKEAPGQAIPRGAWDMIFCTCHMTQYDPILFREYEFLLEVGGAAPGAH